MSLHAVGVENDGYRCQLDRDELGAVASPYNALSRDAV